MNRAALDWARSTLIAGGPEEFRPEPLLFLLRECTRIDDPVARLFIERGLTHALEAVHAERDPCTQVAWVRLLVEAGDFSDDERLRQEAGRALAGAVDALESLVRRSYEPGDGLVGGSCIEHLRCACALLFAFDLTGRVPYPMLAEELWRHAKGRWWDSETGAFDADPEATALALRAACRLADLHADPGYRAAAVVGPGADLAADTHRIARALAGCVPAPPAFAGEIGLALSEWFALESNLQ